jgi:hypothetical protein
VEDRARAAPQVAIVESSGESGRGPRGRRRNLAGRAGGRPGAAGGRRVPPGRGSRSSSARRRRAQEPVVADAVRAEARPADVVRAAQCAGTRTRGR